MSPELLYVWSYDAANRITDQYSRADSNTSATGYDPATYTTWAHAQYNYDPAGQLTSTGSGAGKTYAVTYTNWVNGPQVGSTANAEDYGFDDNGNQKYTNVANNGIAADNQVSSDGTYDYHFDDNGNLTSQVQCTGNTRTDQPHEIDYTYDFRNRLVSVANLDSSNSKTQEVDYVYDAFNRLVGRTITTYGSGGTTATAHYVFDGLNMVLALDNSGNVTNRVLYGPAVDQVLAISSPLPPGEGQGEGVVWALGDNQNTVRDLVQSNGSTSSVVDHRVYTAFGAPISTAAVDFLFGYTGKYYDPATKLQWNLNRWYNPQLQRWMGQDPLGLAPDVNPYRYCGNGSTWLADPNGLAETSPGDNDIEFVPEGGDAEKDASGTVKLEDGSVLNIDVFTEVTVYGKRKNGEWVRDANGKRIPTEGLFQMRASGAKCDDCHWFQFFKQSAYSKGKLVPGVGGELTKESFLPPNVWLIDAPLPPETGKKNPNAIYYDDPSNGNVIARHANDLSIFDRPSEYHLPKEADKLVVSFQSYLVCNGKLRWRVTWDYIAALLPDGKRVALGIDNIKGGAVSAMAPELNTKQWNAGNPVTEGKPIEDKPVYYDNPFFNPK